MIAGCQTGRDYALFSKVGMKCVGVSPSYGLLQEALKRVPEGIFFQSDLRHLPFLPKSFDSVYADVFTMIPKRDFKNTLKDFQIFLKPGGILYLAVKLGEGVLVIEDLGGPRFSALFKKSEVLQTLKSLSMKVLWSVTSEHTDPNLPNWFSLIAQKTK